MLGPLWLGVILLALDATVRVAALAPHVAWTGWVERSVLAGVGRAVLRAQALVQPMAWLAYAVRAGGSDSGDGDVLRLVALVAVAVLLGLLVPAGDGREAHRDADASGYAGPSTRRAATASPTTPTSQVTPANASATR